MLCSVVTKNWNWEVLTKNLVIIMRWRMKNFNIFGVHGKIPVLGGAYEKPIYRGGLPEKEGAWTVFRFKAGLARKREVVFLRGGGGWYLNAHYGYQWSSRHY